ncbi:MAG: hypothetical protein H0T75_16790 [Rhizobiales bacterium]|nr:hypothetical protein [Hyphomicrobiales bacterium]
MLGLAVRDRQQLEQNAVAILSADHVIEAFQALIDLEPSPVRVERVLQTRTMIALSSVPLAGLAPKLVDICFRDASDTVDFLA